MGTAPCQLVAQLVTAARERKILDNAGDALSFDRARFGKYNAVLSLVHRALAIASKMMWTGLAMAGGHSYTCQQLTSRVCVYVRDVHSCAVRDNTNEKK